MNALKTLVNYPFPVNCTPYSEELKTKMRGYLADKEAYLYFRDDLAWKLAYDFHLYLEDAVEFVVLYQEARRRIAL